MTCGACESRQPPRPRNRATVKHETKQWSRVGLDYMDLTLESHETVVKNLVMVEAASQMTMTAVVFARADGEHRNATATETTSLCGKSYLAHYPRPVAVRINKVVFVSCEWSETLTRLDISPDPTAGAAHHDLGDVEKTIQTLKRSAEKLHEIYLQLSAEQVMQRVTSVHNELDRIKGYSPFQWTFAHSRPVWNTEATDSTDPITMEQNLKIRTDTSNVYRVSQI